MNRRAFLGLAAAGGGELLAGRPGHAEGAAATKATYTYKTVDGLEIQADVWRPADQLVRPAMIWIHGGALIMGHRSNLDRLLWYLYQQAGFVIVSIDYRLAPEVKLPAIIEDLRDAHAWVHKKGPDLFRIDPDRIAVSGGSAGGYLTLMSGFCADPRPRSLVSFWGYGDIIGEWYSRPSPFYSTLPAVSKAEAYEAVGQKVISGTPREHNRGRFYLYCRQQGLWPKEVSGHDPTTEAEWFDPYCPVRNVTADYPPTMLVHGQEDTDVPHEQSVLMDRALARAGVEREFLSIPAAGHGLSSAGPEVVADAYERAVRFAKRF